MPSPDPKELAGIASTIAEQAGRLLRASHDLAARTTSTKSSPVDMVSDVDRASETLIVQQILNARPDDAILGEEHGTRDGTTGVRWVIDPLDGTTNYLYGIPMFVVSIAAEYEREPIAGAVYDPSRDEIFVGALGLGASCNGVPLSVSDRSDLATALVGTGFAYDARVRAQQGHVASSVVCKVRDIRRCGSAALDLCWVAAGRYDAYYDRSLFHWDMAAGVLVVSEAGGAVCESADGMRVFAAPGIAEELRQVVRDAEELHPPVVL